MPNVKIEFPELNRVLGSLEKLGPELKRAVAARMNQWGEETMAQSKQRVPVDTGALRSSGHVVAPDPNAQVLQMTLGYGGAAVDYALVVHENLEARHPVGEAKYLERPVMERLGTLDRDLASALEEAARNAGLMGF